jgi:hypothetical protein
VCLVGADGRVVEGRATLSRHHREVSRVQIPGRMASHGCCDIRVVSSRKRRGERVGVGSRGKYPGAPPHHKGKKKRNQVDRKRYLIGLLGERGKAKKKKN